MIFLCQCAVIDGADDWFAINAADAEDAARDYITRCESGSGGEMLNDPMTDKEIVRVKGENGNVTTFEVTVDWSKDFFIRETESTN